MRHPPHVRNASNFLQADLAGWKYPGWSPRAVKVVCPPPLTTEQYKGIDLSRLIIPACISPLPLLQKNFSTLTQWVAEGKPDGVPPPKLEGVPVRVLTFVNYSLSRFTLWAAQHKDMRLLLSDSTILSDGVITVGIDDNKVIGAGIDVKMPLSMDGLDEPIEYKCKESVFVGLWRRAEELGLDDAKNALAALKAYSNQNIINTLGWAARKEVTPSVSTRIEKRLANSPDPLTDVYLMLVPIYFGRRFFESRIAPLSSRRLNPDDEYREMLWERLHDIGYV